MFTFQQIFSKFISCFMCEINRNYDSNDRRLDSSVRDADYEPSVTL